MKRYKVFSSKSGKTVPKSIRANQNSKKRRPIKAAEDYGWVVDSSEAWEAYEFACDREGKEFVDDQIVQTMSTDELAESLAFLFRNWDYEEWYDRNNDDDDDYEEG